MVCPMSVNCPMMRQIMSSGIWNLSKWIIWISRIIGLNTAYTRRAVCDKMPHNLFKAIGLVNIKEFTFNSIAAKLD